MATLTCPACRHSCELAASLDDAPASARPTPGDWGVCYACRAMLRFATGPSLRLARVDELDEAPPELLALGRVVLR